MKLEGEQALLRVWLRNTDRHGWHNAAETLVERAHTAGLAGATVLHGICGFDIRGNWLESKTWSLVEHRPVVIELVDSPRRLGPFLSTVEEVLSEGLVTLERAHVLVYRQRPAAAESVRSQLAVPGAVPPGSTIPLAEEFPVMKLSEEGQLVRVFLGEADVCDGEPLYRAIVLKARELGLAGATVLRGTTGFGATSRIHTSRLLELSTDLPIVVEMVDSAEKIATLLPFLDETVQEGLITIEAVRVLKYLANHDKPRA